MSTSLPTFERCTRFLYLVEIERFSVGSMVVGELLPVYAEADEEAKGLAERIVTKRGSETRLLGITRHAHGFMYVRRRQPGVVDDYRGPLPGKLDDKTLWILQHSDGRQATVHAIYARDEADANSQALAYELSLPNTLPRYKLSCYEHGYNIAIPDAHEKE